MNQSEADIGKEMQGKRERGEKPANQESDDEMRGGAESEREREREVSGRELSKQTSLKLVSQCNASQLRDAGLKQISCCMFVILNIFLLIR